MEKRRIFTWMLEAVLISGILVVIANPAYAQQKLTAAERRAGREWLSLMDKNNDKLVVLGGALGEQKLDANAVKTLAEMPSLDELRAKLVGLIQAPATKLAQLSTAPAAKLARVFGAYAEKDAA